MSGKYLRRVRPSALIGSLVASTSVGFAVLLALSSVGGANVALAKGPPKSIEVPVQIRTADGANVFAPDKLAFERGKFYKLVISNNTDKSRYFTAAGLATRVFSRKVEVLDASGKMLAEVHGQVNNFELSPGATVAWYFYPMINGADLPMLSKRRKEPPISGTISVSGPPPFSRASPAGQPDQPAK